MDDKGEILSSCDVDDKIALQIWTKGLSPRLVILNKAQNSRKLIRFNWLEKLDRKLSVKGEKRGQSSEYSLADLLPHVQRAVSEYAMYANVRPLIWKLALTLEKVVHSPAVVTAKGELSLLGEDKRSCLWLADLTGDVKGEGHFRPFFPLSGKERDAIPEPGLPITDNRRGLEDLLKTGVLRKLAAGDPARWHSPLRVIAAAILLAFSFCNDDGGEDGTKFSDEVWRNGDANLTKVDDPRLLGMGRKFVAYVRHFAALDKITLSSMLDSDKDLQADGYTRKRRIEFPEKLIGDVPYSVTFFDREDGMTALGCKPRSATLRHKGELVFSLPTAVHEAALLNDSFGGSPDDYFTVAQLAAAKEFEAWSQNLTAYIAPFAGLQVRAPGPGSAAGV